MSGGGGTGAILLRAGLVEAAALARASELQAQRGGTLGRALAELSLADESRVAAALASSLRLELVTEPPRALGADVAALLPMELCRRHLAVPLGLEKAAIRLAVADPLNYAASQDVEFRTGKRTLLVVATQTWVEETLALTFGAVKPPTSFDSLTDTSSSVEVEAAHEYELTDPKTLQKDVHLPPIVKLANLVLSEAAASGASDVHVEPQENGLLVRQRIDGLLRDAMTIPRHLQDQTISRFKIIAGMDIAERRKPQDGRCRLRFDGRRIDLRVSTLPTQFGEKVVIRFLNAEAAVLPLDQLGFAADNLQRLRSFLSRPQGMILVTGPTGSGKTSTLYASLNSIKSPTNNIITLEDPIEFQVPGVNQTQINPRAGVTFASGLRSILRQDPNVILVGEIRDLETASIALEAAQTGHLLLSTLHTNDAPATITRLFDLGVQPFLVAASVIGIVGQRLVRRPCPSCAVDRPPADETVEKLGGWSHLPADARWTAGTGCERCDGSGSRGRLAIHEVLEVNDEIRSLIASRATEQTIKATARRASMRTLLEDGIEKAAQGLTTLEEVLRVVPSSETRDRVTASTSTAADAAEAPLPPGPRRVLVVEDSPTIVAVVKYFLELEGFEVTVAENGQSGLETAIREQPHVIVTDLNMPGMTGLEMVRELRKEPSLADVRVLMLTTDTSVESETENLAAGADDYIPKPVEPRRLAARVRALFARR